MPRSVNTVASRKRRKKILKLAKGYFGRKKNVWTVAKNQVEKGWLYAYRDRRAKKREFRRLWIQRINAAARMHDMSYSVFMGRLNKVGVELNRKVLADLAMNHPDAFAAIVDVAKNGKEVEKKDRAVKVTASKGSAKGKAKETPKAEKPAPKPKAKKAETPAPVKEEAPVEVAVAEAPSAEEEE